MSNPDPEIESSTTDDLGETPLYRDNLIYLPFARHLSEVDETEERALKAA